MSDLKFQRRLPAYRRQRQEVGGCLRPEDKFSHLRMGIYRERVRKRLHIRYHVKVKILPA